MGWEVEKGLLKRLSFVVEDAVSFGNRSEVSI